MNKLVITTKNEVICYGYFQDGRAVELFCEKKDSPSLLGNIYVARVDKVAEGIQGAFLDLSDTQKAYYNLSPSKKPIKLSPGHEDKLYGGDLILVQVTKDAVKTKLPVADSNVSIPGKYFVLSFERKGVNVSKKINDLDERSRLQKIAKEMSDGSCGIVIRTNAQGVADAILKEELSELLTRYHKIMQKAQSAPGKTLVGKEEPFYIRYGQELPSSELDEILTDDPAIYEQLKEYFDQDTKADLARKLAFYKDDYSLYLLYRFDHYYDLASKKLVPLKSGGSIVIEQTEAMVVIDVNSGAVLKGKKKAESIFEKMNREAAVEIVDQLRLRNLSGIIMIDFINMKEAGSQKRLLDFLREECRRDRIPCRVVDFTALNLVEMTRNKVRRSLAEQRKDCQI